MITRRQLIERYLDYDSVKKSTLRPDTENWNWNDPDDLENRLVRAGFKGDCLVGFRSWKPIELDQVELGKSAVVISISRCIGSEKRTLAELAKVEGFQFWKPKGPRDWYDQIEKGEPFDENWLMIARPTVPCERPGKYYFIDGSGRATAIYRKLLRDNDIVTKITIFMGEEPDETSDFMRKNYPILLKKE